jgi:hypothetical protein
MSAPSPAIARMLASLKAAKAEVARIEAKIMRRLARDAQAERGGANRRVRNHVGAYLLAERRKRSRADWAAWLESFMVARQPLSRRQVSRWMRKARDAERVASGGAPLPRRRPW